MSGRQYDGTAATTAAPDCAGRNGAHTPGPWHLSVNGVNAVDSAVIIDGNGGEVLGVSEWCRLDKADAILMVAAPELLAALRTFFDNDEYCKEDYDAAGAAIAKAEGR